MIVVGDTIVEDASSIKDPEGAFILSITRLVLTTTNAKWPRGKLLGEK